MENKKKINHILHLFLSIITFGAWMIVWGIITLRKATKPSGDERIKKAKGKWKPWHIWVLAICGLFTTCTIIIGVTVDVPESSYQYEPQEQEEEEEETSMDFLMRILPVRALRLMKDPTSLTTMQSAQAMAAAIAYRDVCRLTYNSLALVNWANQIPLDSEAAAYEMYLKHFYKSYRNIIEEELSSEQFSEICYVIESSVIKAGFIE